MRFLPVTLKIRALQHASMVCPPPSITKSSTSQLMPPLYLNLSSSLKIIFESKTISLTPLWIKSSRYLKFLVRVGSSLFLIGFSITVASLLSATSPIDSLLSISIVSSQITIKASPAFTTLPDSTKISSTTPSTSDWMSFSIFIASTTHTVDPAITLSPTLTLSLITIPFIEEMTVLSIESNGESTSPTSINPFGMILNSYISPIDSLLPISIGSSMISSFTSSLFSIDSPITSSSTFSSSFLPVPNIFLRNSICQHHIILNIS